MVQHIIYSILFNLMTLLIPSRPILCSKGPRFLEDFVMKVVMCFIFFRWAISAITEAPIPLEGPQVWRVLCYCCCKICNDF